MNVKNSFVFT